MACTPPRTPSPNSITSMPVSVIMLGRKDGTAEPVGGKQQQQQLRPTLEPSAAIVDSDGDSRFDNGRHVFFVENKNTNRSHRNANFGMEQIFVANKDTNRETSSCSAATRRPAADAPSSLVPDSSSLYHRAPIAIAPKLGPNSTNNQTAARVIPMPATIFLAPCDSNGQITHFVLTAATASQPVMPPQAPISKVISTI